MQDDDPEERLCACRRHFIQRSVRSRINFTNILHWPCVYKNGQCPRLEQHVADTLWWSCCSTNMQLVIAKVHLSHAQHWCLHMQWIKQLVAGLDIVQFRASTRENNQSEETIGRCLGVTWEKVSQSVIMDLLKASSPLPSQSQARCSLRTGP